MHDDDDDRPEAEYGITNNAGKNAGVDTENKKKQRRTRYAVSQELIDEILQKELAGLNFPVHPIYISDLRNVNGRVRYRTDMAGETSVTAIEIGKQDRDSRRFLIDTLLHEYYEAEIINRQNNQKLYRKLHISTPDKRHFWINKQIEKYFDKMEDDNELE